MIFLLAFFYTDSILTTVGLFYIIFMFSLGLIYGVFALVVMYRGGGLGIISLLGGIVETEILFI